MGVKLPFPFFSLPSSLLLFLIPLFPHLLPATDKESAGALKPLVGPGGARPPNDFSEFWAERVLLVMAILVIITYICSP